MKKSVSLLFILIIIFTVSSFPQEEEPIRYFQMEPLDDSLFVSIQQQVFIDPPDPKAEIIVDLRDMNNATVSIKGVLYPFLAFNPDTRARISVYPFKLNLEESIGYGSVFTRVIERMKFSKLISPPRAFQISPTLAYINPFLEIFGGERFGASIKQDIGISFGLGTPYSGPLETNFIEANFHIIGFSVGVFSVISELVEPKKFDKYNNLYCGTGIQFNYTVPFGNFFQMGYLKSIIDLPDWQKAEYSDRNDSTFHQKFITGNFFNWELRYPIIIFGATRSKFYAARYLNEYHFGFTGRELSVAGSTFDLRLDVMSYSDERNPQLVLDILVQRIFDNWGFSSIAMGPAMIFTRSPEKRLAISSAMLNLRFKLGTSL